MKLQYNTIPSAILPRDRRNRKKTSVRATLSRGARQPDSYTSRNMSTCLGGGNSIPYLPAEGPAQCCRTSESSRWSASSQSTWCLSPACARNKNRRKVDVWGFHSREGGLGGRRQACLAGAEGQGRHGGRCPTGAFPVLSATHGIYTRHGCTQMP